MDRFRNILVVIDDTRTDSAALGRAVSIAQRHGARVTAVHPFDGSGHGVTAVFDGITAHEVERVECEARLEELAALVRTARAPDVDIVPKLLVGTPFIEIVREVIRGGYDLVLKDAQPPDGRTERVFSSLDLHLMRKCPAPLWVLKPGERARSCRIVATVNPDVEDAPHESVNRAVLDLAAAVARFDGGELHVVHAWYLYGEEILRSPRVCLPAGRVDALVEQERARRSGLVEALVREYRAPDLAILVHLVKGEAGQILPAALRQLRADLVVMGTVARTGIPGLIIGNTAETVLGEVTCSVLAVKPPGFVSPIRLPDSEAGPGDRDSTAAQPTGDERIHLGRAPSPV
jgi:nucleotide-binding universal stress UspA family protein